MSKFVYLGGAILGCIVGEANDWRRTMAAALLPHGIIGISPLRCEPIVGERYAASYDDELFGTSRAIGSKNSIDVRRCDLMVANLPKPPEGRSQSWGTIWEMGGAHFLGKPVVLVTDDPKVIEHPVLNFGASWVLRDLDQAADLIIGLLGGYNGGKHV